MSTKEGALLCSRTARSARQLSSPAECESPMVEQPGGLFGECPRCGFGANEIPGLVGRDFEMVLAIDDGGRYASGPVGWVSLDALSHQVPARHPLEDLTSFLVVTDGA